jgi:hypothetical protein
MVPATKRMLRLGVVADARWEGAALAALPQLVSGAGLDAIWCSHRAPTGPLSQMVVDRLTVSATGLGVITRDERGLALWAGGPLPGGGGDPAVFVPASPQRSLASLIATWQIERRRPGELVVEVPVSIGRTRAEAEARATDWFAELGSPREQGLFGTLEDCQEQAGALAVLGVRDLCCVLPGSDVADVIAQLSAVGIGSVATHGPGAVRSPSPPPPRGWGGPARGTRDRRPRRDPH